MRSTSSRACASGTPCDNVVGRIVLASAKREELGQVEERGAVQEQLAEDAPEGEDVRRLRDDRLVTGRPV